MKALLYRTYGGSDVVEYDEAARPVPGPRQVLVNVAETSFNPVDVGIPAATCPMSMRSPSRTSRALTSPAR